MADQNRDAEPVSALALQFSFPEPGTAVVAAARITEDQELSSCGKRGRSVLLFLGLSCIVPLIHLLALSFSDRALLRRQTGGLVTLWPVRPTAITYEKVLAAGVFINAFWISC